MSKTEDKQVYCFLIFDIKYMIWWVIWIIVKIANLLILRRLLLGKIMIEVWCNKTRYGMYKTRNISVRFSTIHNGDHKLTLTINIWIHNKRLLFII